MDVFQLVKDTLVDPANRTVMPYTIAAAFFLFALLFALAGRRKYIGAKDRGVAVGQDNSGVIITGDVGGNVDASVKKPSDQPTTKEPASIKLLSLLAALSGIISAVFAVLAYFLPPIGP